jgi:hypothetical protein
MTEPRAIRRHAPVAIVAAIATVAAFVVGMGPQVTDASWGVTKTMAITATAVIPAVPSGLSCPSGGLLSAAIPFTWTVPAGTPPSGYTLKWTGDATGSTTSTTNSANVNSPLGNITVSVYSDYGTWQSAAAIQTRHVFGVIIVGWTCGA